MTDRESRERLVELIIKCDKDDEVLVCFNERPRKTQASEVIADHLIENGVILPPCKVGDTVYVLETCHCYCGYSEHERCHHRRTRATKWIDMVRLPSKHHTKCLKLFARPFKWDYYSKLGKTVFLTKEEAERALKEREKV